MNKVVIMLCRIIYYEMQSTRKRSLHRVVFPIDLENEGVLLSVTQTHKTAH